MNLRIGQGFDVHAFDRAEVGDQSNASITLGGVAIPSNWSLIAHSDGDVLLHALCDALLGALALGYIGHHFPDSDQKWKNADSRELLRQVFLLVAEEGYSLMNTDMTIVAQSPKMAPYITMMRENIAADLNVELDQVSVKATTTEYLGFTGREEGIACFASVLLSK